MTGLDIEIPERENVLQRAVAGQSLALVGRQGKSWLLEQVRAKVPDAVRVRVCSGPDQVAHLVLSAAEACGGRALRTVAAGLRSSVDAGVAALESQLGERALLVDDADAIGVKGFDRELGLAMRADVERVRRFVADRARVITVTTGGDQLGARASVELHPYVNDLRWQKVNGDVDLFRVALLRDQISGSEPGEEASWQPEDIVADVWAALPEWLQELVELLAVQGRPIPKRDFEQLALVEPSSLEAAVSDGVVLDEGGALRLPKPWYARFHERSSGLRAVRLELAEAFARHAIGKEAALERPLFVLEAHRHFAVLGEIDRAREFAKFGAATLLDAAREISLRGREDASLFSKAASTYDVVLRIEAELRPHGTLGDRVLAYATHYKHYNRYKATPSEPFVDTVAGYRDALARWPENALFHSRLIGALMVGDDYEAAAVAIRDAVERVPAHPRRDALLRGRTTDKLLRRNKVEAALLVWDGYEPGTLERDVERRLRAALSQLSLQRLRSFSSAIVLNEPVTLRFFRASAGWTALALDLAGHGDTPADAYAGLIAKIRERVTHLHRTLTHELTPAERMEKQRLLGVVDLAASGLLVLGSGWTWVYGRLAELDGEVVFRTHQGHVLALDDTIAAGKAAESSHRLARVKTGDAGQPEGPVVELEPPLGEDPANALVRWQARLAADG